MHRPVVIAFVVVLMVGCATPQTPPAPSPGPEVVKPPVTPPPTSAGPATVVLDVVRDARITCHPSEAGMNSGASNRLRTVGIQKESAEVSILDFDHAALRAFVENNAGKEITGSLRLGVRQCQNGPAKVEVCSLDSAVDWVEGTQIQQEADKGTCSCSAAQAGVKPWTTSDGKEVKTLIDLLFDKEADKIRTLLNSGSVEVETQNDGSGKEVMIDLDAAFVKHLATNANCRGIVLFNRHANAKVDFFSRDQRNNAPKLTLTAK